MRAAVITGPGHVEVTTVDDPAPGPGEVVLAVAAVGVCGTDVHILAGEFAPRLPLVPGHEFAGEVVALGAGVEGLRVGDRVAADPNTFCHGCWYCRRGQANHCERFAAVGVTHPGAAAEYVAVAAGNCVVLPDHVPVADAALVEPLSCAVHGFDVLRARPASSVLLYGAGTMGLMMLELAKRGGAARGDADDGDPARLATAQALGCSAAATSADELDRPRGWDVVVDATGNVAAIRDGLGRVARRGTFLQFGVAPEGARVEIEPYRVFREEITIVGSFAVLDSYERAAELFADGIVDPQVLVSHRLPLEEYPKALSHTASGVGRKILVVPR